ncbi:MAG TPA: hypothetical protein VGG89_02625 [Candidatus Baltobacteraceae bacterium]|jgi:hypothetical protein
MKPAALLHVGLAKCASTFLGDQALKAQQRGVASALVWRPFDLLINRAFAELGGTVVAFPDSPPLPVTIPTDRPLIATNECLTGHFPQPLRLVSHPIYTGDTLKALQRRVAELLRAMSVEALSPFDVTVLLIVRSPQRWLHSLYRNLVVMGVAESAEIFFDRFGGVVVQWADVDYLVQLYAELFGKERVRILPVEMLRDDTATFFARVNEMAGAQVLLDNEPRNVGLSDGASERLRALWGEIDRIAPPQPSWSNRTVRFKQETWEFLHNAVLNDESAVKRANEVWRDDRVIYEMPRALVETMQTHMTALRHIEGFERYREEYFSG